MMIDNLKVLEREELNIAKRMGGNTQQSHRDSIALLFLLHMRKKRGNL